MPERRRRKYIPQEIIYADDTDFISKTIETLNNILNESSEILGEWSLCVNVNKTHRTHRPKIKREENKENETWRDTKKL